MKRRLLKSIIRQEFPASNRGERKGGRDMKNKRVSCKGNAADIPACEYDSAWICKHPKCKSIVLTSTMYGARPSGCPKVDTWNRRVEG